jgi:hypothetical protein
MSTISPEKTQSGMGATPHEPGVAFRVWAPHADAVYVVGSFNDWSSDTHPMEREGEGYWYADISSAAIGNEYRYRIVNGDKQLLRLDPYPGPVLRGKPVSEPHNLGPGWVGFNFEAAFGCPVKLLNDAAMQALGSYEGGKMLFLGLGTGLGSTMIVDGIVEPMELGHLPYKKRTYEDYVGIRGWKRVGKKMAALCRGRRGAPDRRTRTGLCGPWGRQRP